MINHPDYFGNCMYHQPIKYDRSAIRLIRLDVEKATRYCIALTKTAPCMKGPPSLKQTGSASSLSPLSDSTAI